MRRRKRASARVEDGPLVAGELEIRADQFQAFVRATQHRPHAARVRGAPAAGAGRGQGPPARGDLPGGVGLRDGPRRPFGRRVHPQGPPEAREGLAATGTTSTRTSASATASTRSRATTRTDPPLVPEAPDLAEPRSPPSPRSLGPSRGALRVTRRRTDRDCHTSPPPCRATSELPWSSLPWPSLPSPSSSPGRAMTTSPILGHHHPGADRAETDTGDRLAAAQPPRPSPPTPPVTRIAINGGMVAGESRRSRSTKGDTVRIVVTARRARRDPPARLRHRAQGGARAARPLPLQGQRRGRVRDREPRGRGRRPGAARRPPASSHLRDPASPTGSSPVPTSRSPSGCSAGPPRWCWWSPSSRSPCCGPSRELERERWRPLPGALGRVLAQPAGRDRCAGRSASRCSGSSSTPGCAGTQSAAGKLRADLRLRDLLARRSCRPACCSATSSRPSTPGARSGARWAGSPRGPRAATCPRRSPIPSASATGRRRRASSPSRCIELVASNGDQPETLAIATLVYSALTFVAMALYGVETLDRARRGLLGLLQPLLAPVARSRRATRVVGLRRAAVGAARAQGRRRAPCRCWP